jgi:hypothetical protein
MRSGFRSASTSPSARIPSISIPSAAGKPWERRRWRTSSYSVHFWKGSEGGGVYVNVGSAVVLPEVFLKAVSYVRNKGVRLDRFSTALFDFLRLYRPDQNVVRRVLGKRGKGYYFTGHHEIMIPLLAAALTARR